MKFLAGGTNLVDLMKENVERPDNVVDINACRSAGSSRSRTAALGSAPWPPMPTTAYHPRDCRTLSAAGVGHLVGSQPATAQCRDQRRQSQSAHAMLLFLRPRDALQQAAARQRVQRDRRVSIAFTPSSEPATAVSRHILPTCAWRSPRSDAQRERDGRGGRASDCLCGLSTGCRAMSPGAITPRCRAIL